MQSLIMDCHREFYIPEIQKLTFHLPHVRIIGTHQCCNTRWETFKRRSAFQDVLFHHDYSERVLYSFSHQVKYEHYGGNRYVSIEDILLERFSDTHQETYSYSVQSCTRHALFHSFISDNRKRYAATTAAHIKRTIDILNNSKYLGARQSSIQGNKYVYADHYRCATALYLF